MIFTGAGTITLFVSLTGMFILMLVEIRDLQKKNTDLEIENFLLNNENDNLRGHNDNLREVNKRMRLEKFKDCK